MHVVALRLANWGPYRGDATILLEPSFYAVTSERDGDSERSNWGSKSYLLEAIPFGLFGCHRHRREEDWLSHGEVEGGVGIVFSTGLEIQRWRKPGGGTQIDAWAYGQHYRGEEAQRAIERTIGLTLEDFRTTSWLQQGEASAIVRGDPATRTAMVSRWLGLEKVERALSLARTKALSADRALEDVRAKARALTERANRLVEAQPSFGLLTAYEGKLLEWEQLLEMASEEEADRRLAEERQKIEQECGRLREELGEAAGDQSQNVLTSRDARDAARARLQAATVKRANRASVASGAFHGRCPVAGIACPAKDEINDLGDAAREEAEAAEHAWADAKTESAAAEAALRLVEQRETTRNAKLARLQTLQERLDSMGGGSGAPEGFGLVLGQVRAQRDAVAADVAGIRARLLEHREVRREHEALQEELTRLGREVATAREGTALLARAPRRLAEGALGRIAADGNGILTTSGIDLAFDVHWERETKDLAESCESCGRAFPRSAKVKACEGCGAPRGSKKIRRLDYELSDRSGAAEDLVGLAMAFSAGAWLRGERGSSFGVLLGDELSAQLDRAHRRVMSQHLPAMLKAARIEQSMIVSHSPDAVASLPGRIRISRKGKWSTVSVE